MKNINSQNYQIKYPHNNIYMGKDFFANFKELILQNFKDASFKDFLLVTDVNIYNKILLKYSFIKDFPNKIILSHKLKANINIAHKIVIAAKKCKYLIAIGSGTINDLVKYASYLSQKKYLLFATAPSMNGYLSKNASLINNQNIKISFEATIPSAVYFDLKILSNANLKLINSGLGDIICSNTVRNDWLLSHYLLEKKFSNLNFEYCKNLENILYKNINLLQKRNLKMIEILTEILIINGLNMYDFNSSDPASQGEHMIAHLYNMICPKTHNFHGEEIAFTTLYMSKLQEKFILNNQAPKLQEKIIAKEDFIKLFGAKKGLFFYNEFQKKYIHPEDISFYNQKLENMWSDFQNEIFKNYLPSTDLKKILFKASSLPKKLSNLNWKNSYFKFAVNNALFTRNRFTFLDLEFYKNKY